MFGFGIVEGLIVLVLLSWVFRDWIGRRWPRLGGSIRVMLLLTLAGVLLFDLITFLGRSAGAG